MRKLRLAIMCVACAGLLVVPAVADAQKSKQQQGTGQCRSLERKVEAANQRLAQAQTDVASAKATVAKRKAAYNKAKSKGKRKKAKAKRRLRRAKAELKAEKASVEHAQKRVESVNKQFAAAGAAAKTGGRLLAPRRRLTALSEPSVAAQRLARTPRSCRPSGAAPLARTRRGRRPGHPGRCRPRRSCGGP